MAKGVIAKLPLVFTPGGYGVFGGGWSVPEGYWVEDARAAQELSDLADGKPVAVEVTVKKLKSARTVEQNRLMWALCGKIASFQAGGGGPCGGSPLPWGVYIDMLAEYGEAVDYLTVPYRALGKLKNAWRVVQVIEMLDGGLCSVRCVAGSSCFSTAEMATFIDRLFDRLAELGVDDAETTAEYRAWREAKQ